jgi:hypothetical protein
MQGITQAAISCANITRKVTTVKGSISKTVMEKKEGSPYTVV